MYRELIDMLPQTVPLSWAVGLGAAGLGAGILYMRVVARDTLSKAREFMRIGIRYEGRADLTYAKTRALTEPTQSVPIVQLRQETRTLGERLMDSVAVAADRAHDMVTRTPVPRDWAPGEMTDVFNAITADHARELADAHPHVVHPLAPGRMPAPAQAPAPPLVRETAPVRSAPAWVDGGTPPPRRASLMRSLAPRARSWTYLAPLPVMQQPTFPEPFRMPEQRRRVTPHVMASLPQDPTRQWRTKTQAVAP